MVQEVDSFQGLHQGACRDPCMWNRFLLANFCHQKSSGQVRVTCPSAEAEAEEILVIKDDQMAFTDAVKFQPPNVMHVDPEKFTLLQLYGN